MEKNRFKIGDYVKLPAGTYVWCVDLQRSIAFEKDEIFKLTHGSLPESDCYFAKLQLVLFNCPGCIPGIGDNHRGEVSIAGKDVTKWELPEPQLLNFYY
jgi:hypothetical protein